MDNEEIYADIKKIRTKNRTLLELEEGNHAGNYDRYELISALQKSIRRGLEEEALYWAFELFDSGMAATCLSRLSICAHEDVGMADMQAALFAMKCVEDTREYFKKGNGAWRLSLTNVVLSLARAEKSRESDHAQCVVCGRRAKGWKLDMPDWARDKHTWRGAKMGRGMKHCIESSFKLQEERSHHDRYKDEAEQLWLEFEFAEKTIYGEPNKKHKQTKVAD